MVIDVETTSEVLVTKFVRVVVAKVEQDMVSQSVRLGKLDKQQTTAPGN